MPALLRYCLSRQYLFCINEVSKPTQDKNTCCPLSRSSVREPVNVDWLSILLASTAIPTSQALSTNFPQRPAEPFHHTSSRVPPVFFSLVYSSGVPIALSPAASHFCFTAILSVGITCFGSPCFSFLLALFLAGKRS